MERTARQHREASRSRFGSLEWRAGNAFVGLLARLGIGPIHLLTTTGARSGRPHTCPVVPVEQGGKTWLVAPYGPVAWVHNVRTHRAASLRYGRATDQYVAHEAPAAEAGPVLRQYVKVATKTRSQFDATQDSPLEDWIAEADDHPVFELIPASDPAD